MTDEKRRKKFGLSLKTSKKTVFDCNEESKIISRQLTKNVCHAKPKINSHSKSVVINVDDLDAQQSKLNYEIKTNTDSYQNEKEKLLWRNIFSTERQVSWENLEALPKFNGVTSAIKKQDNANIAASATTKQMLTSNKDNTKDLFSSDVLDYVELPKPCLSCYTRKPVQLKYSAEEMAIPQSTNQEVEQILANEQQKLNLDHYINKNNSRTVSPVVEDIDDDEMLSILDSEPPKRKVTDCDQNWESGFHQIKKPSLGQNRIQGGKVAGINLSKEKYRKKDNQSSCQKNQNTSLFHGNSNDNHKFPSHAKSKSISRSINYQEKCSRQQSHNSTPQKMYSSYFQRKELVTERTFSADNIVIDLTDDYKTESNSFVLDYQANKVSQKSTKLDSNVFNEKPMSYKSFGERKLSKNNSNNSNKEELKSCPICQLKFSCRTSKQDIEKHISSCIGDEVIVDDNSDEDWLFIH